MVEGNKQSSKIQFQGLYHLRGDIFQITPSFVQHTNHDCEKHYSTSLKTLSTSSSEGLSCLFTRMGSPKTVVMVVLRSNKERIGGMQNPKY